MKIVLEKRARIVVASLILLLGTPLLANAVNALVGSDGGSVSVGNGGEAVWSLPIDVPKGINGLTPNLTLSVSSNSGNGTLGLGGGLSGLSSIARCSRTIHQDGYVQTPRYLQDDAYCLDGARLALETGVYGASGSTYRTQLETFQRIIAHGGEAGRGPDYFEVINRNGAKTVYGKSALSKDIDDDTEAVVVWRVEKLIDSDTNTLTYHYADVSGQNEVQLKKITYGGNQSLSLPEKVEVELVYEGRPDVSLLWLRGQATQQTKRLSVLRTSVAGQIAKEYRISYELGEVSGFSRLSQVQLCAGSGECYRPTKFNYAPEQQAEWMSSNLELPSGTMTADGKPMGIFVDINNDGMTDWVEAYTSKQGTTSVRTWEGTRGGWVRSSEFDLPGVLFDYSMSDDGLAKGLLVDIDGDAWPEYVQAYRLNGEIVNQTWRNTGSTFQRAPSLDLPTSLVGVSDSGEAQSYADVGDINLDGLVDIVSAVKVDNETILTTWLGKQENGQHSWVISEAYRAPTLSVIYAQGQKGKILASINDVDGDGLSDWLESYKLDGTTHNRVWINTGRGWSESPEYRLPVAVIDYDLVADGVVLYSLTDINADGLLDLVKAINLTNLGGGKEFDTWLNNGLGWHHSPEWNLPNNMYQVSGNGNHETFGGLIDLNGDGQPDFVRSAHSVSLGETAEKFYLFDKQSNQWVETDAYSFPFINNYLRADGTSFSVAEVVDIDQDGFPELINALTGSVYQSLRTSAGFPGTLIGTVDPMGNDVVFEYSMSTDPTVYEPADMSPYPNVAHNAPFRVVSRVTTSNGVGGFVTASHKYGKAKTSLIGQGGLGFQYREMVDGETGVKVNTEFHQVYPYAGRIKGSVKTLDGTVLSESNSQTRVESIVLNGLTTSFAHPFSSTSTSFDLDGVKIKSTLSTSEIDNFGNTTVSIESVFDGAGNLVRSNTQQISYKTPDLQRWLFGLPTRTIATVHDEVLDETYTNESVADFYPDGKPEFEILEPTSDKWVKRYYSYDAFGNRREVVTTAAGIEGSRSEVVTYTPDGRFPETASNALAHTSTTEFDAVLGKPLSVTDANGIKKEFVYDGFGTVLKETKAHQNNGVTRGRQIVLPRWCVEGSDTNCPENAIYFIAAFDDEGEAPEIIYYNALGKELRKQTYGFNGRIIVIDTEYAPNGKVQRVSQPYFKDQASQVTWTEFEYDVLGREVKRINPEGSVFLTRYDLLTVETENPGNNDTAAQINTVVHNIFGQPIEAIDSDQNSTKYEYDGRGKLVKTTDARDNVSTITYDPVFGRKVAMQDPDLGQWTYEYDALGHLIAQTDALDQRTEMFYDVLGRLVRRVDDVGGSKEETTTWDYSNVKGNGQLIGGLEKVTSAHYERRLKYDEMSRVIESTSIINDQTFTQRTGYLGTADKIDWVQYPSGLAVRNTYDEYGFPKTVEGLTLDLSKYQEYQVASAELNNLQRQLEAYKDERLSDSELFELEEHERQIRRLGKALSDFYDLFEDNPIKQGYEDEATRYGTLVERVQQKLVQHSNWFNIYQQELTSRYDRIEDDLDRLKEIPQLVAPYQRQYDDAKVLHDGYAAKVSYYAERLNAHGSVINHHLGIARDARVHVNNLLNSLYKPEHASRYSIPSNLDMSGIETMAYDYECCTLHVINNFMKTQSPEMIENHFNQIENWVGVIETSAGHIDHHQKIIDDNRYEYWYNHWETRRSSEESKMTSAAAKINQYASETSTLSTRVQPDLDRINDWLAPITLSHGNVSQSFKDRARTYIAKISDRTGTYAKREDLKTENFLASFKNHVEYIRCLRDQTSKPVGRCYAENLVHVFNDDGTVDSPAQNQARENVDDDQLVDVRDFWSTRRFFCASYHGYSCPGKFSSELEQLAKTLHLRQCARMTTEQKSESSVPCDSARWQDTFTSNGVEYPRYPYLASNVVDFSSNLNSYNALMDAKHRAEVERLVYNATRNSYNEETSYADIIQLGGNLWQAAEPEPVAAGEVDPREFVLLRKGSVQTLADSMMDSVAREANRNLKAHQYAVAELLNEGNNTAYQTLYLAVQNQTEKVDRLYREVDQAYAAASNDDDFDSEQFEQTKKIYWRAEDINAQGQILKAKYGNGTVTQWSYDQFGRINSHFTQNANGNTLLHNTYEYDLLGNLTQRVDTVEDLTENFSYDILNRLVHNSLSGTGASFARVIDLDSVEYDYDALGNLTYKSDILGGGASGHYVYGDDVNSVGPHAVTSITGLGSFAYDANGNQLSGNGRSVVYSAFNKPVSITKNGNETKMWYGAERQLIQQQQQTPSGVETTRFVGGMYEQIQVQGGGITNRHYIAVAGSPIAVLDTNEGSLAVTKESYLHKNHQGSVLAISDANGEVRERRYYDAFGDIKSYIGQANNQYGSWVNYGTATALAFTGHRTMLAAGVIHMGGRVYDAGIGRFLSADPHIQSPLNSQSLNRYSYTLNNPLSWTDPSGYFFKSFFKGLKKLFSKFKELIKKVSILVRAISLKMKAFKKIKTFVKKYYRVIVAVVVAVVAVYFGQGWLADSSIGWATSASAASASGLSAAGAAALGAVAGGLSGLIATGSFKGMIEGAFFGAVTAGFAQYVNTGAQATRNAAWELWGNGTWSTSAYKSAISAVNFANKAQLLIGHAVIGGARAVYNGGKFLTGALTAGLGKLVTFGSNAFVQANNISNKLVQGLVVATAGGVASVIAGGSFQLGFLTAGLAFAVNELLSNHPKLRSSSGRDEIRGPRATARKILQSRGLEPATFSLDVDYDVRAGAAWGVRVRTPYLFKVGVKADFYSDSLLDDDVGGHRQQFAIDVPGVGYSVERNPYYSSTAAHQFNVFGVDFADESIEFAGADLCFFICGEVSVTGRQVLPQGAGSN